MTGGWVARPHGHVRHYAGLASPAAMVAGRAVGTDRPAERLGNVLAWASRRRQGTQRGLVAAPGGRLRWRAVAAPAHPGPEGAIVHPIAMATCDMDRPLIMGATPFPLPVHLGHECVAEVVRVGDEVTGVRPGDRVVVPFQLSCGTCPPCRQHRPGSCTGLLAASMYGFGLAGGAWGGVMADLVGVPFADAMLVPLPAGLDPVACASVADNVSDGWRHIGPHLPALLDLDPDARVVLVSALDRHERFTPSLPLYAGLVARALGGRHVEVVDARPGVRAHAERLGLGARGPGDLGGIEPAPLMADVTGSARGLRACLALTAPDGLCTSAGGLYHSVRLPLLRSFLRNVTVRVGRTHARAVIPHVLELIGQGRLHPEEVTTNVAPLDDGVAALDAHCHEHAVKTVLTA